MPMHAAIYTRISKDSTREGAGVRRQEQECRKLAAERGLTVAAVYSDNDISAYSGKRRPAYEELLAAISSGTVDAVICWHTDRLYRRVSDLEQYINVCQPKGVPTYAVQAGPLDLATPSGRMVARQLGAVGQYEAEQKGERHRAANVQRARQGKHFGTRRCFGYEPDGLTLRPAEAEAIREGYRLILNGGSLNEVARRWNAAGLHGPQGKIKLPPDVAAEWQAAVEAAQEQGEAPPPRPFVPTRWTGPVVSRTLRTARLAGLKTYRGEVVRGEDGEPIPAEWPAVVDLETWRAAQEVLNAPDRQRFPSAERQLLSGLALCADCGAPMQSGGTRNGRRRYRCSQKAGHVYREAAPIDEYVELVVLARLAEADAGDLLAAPSTVNVDAVRAELREVAARQAAMAEAFAEGAVTMAQLKAATARLETQAADLEALLPKPTNPAIRQLVDADDVTAAWDRLDQDAKRSVIGALCTVEVIAPGTKENAYVDWRQRIINPDTLRITWLS